jgi:urease accessory protein
MTTMHRPRAAAVLLLVPATCTAHADGGRAFGFVAGLLHPFTGPDHVLAMLAVGMWGAQLRGDAVWALPVAFPLVMALGAAAGILGLPMFPIEPGVAVSVLVLGAVIATGFRPRLRAAVALVGVFAIFHGYAHGAELPRRAEAVAYCAGFVLATGCVHLGGIAIGQVTRLRHGAAALRAGGAAIAISGLGFAAALLLG